MKIAVVGSGISGLATALALQEKHEVSLFEKNNRLGGQYKIPRLSNDRKIIDEILCM